MTEDPNELVRTKVLQVFGFLRQLFLIRHPVPLRISEQPFVMMLDPHIANEFVSMSIPLPDPSLEDEQTDVLLRVRRPDFQPAPSIPQALIGWLDVQVGDVEHTPKPHRSLIVAGVKRLFEDDVTRRRQFDAWLREWSAWVPGERKARSAQVLYDRLYQLYSELERESEQFDLMIGDGHLAWSRNGDDDLDHPLLLKRVELGFDASVPEFTVRDTERPTELYDALLSKIEDLNSNLIQSTKGEIVGQNLHPFGGAPVDVFLSTLVSSMAAQGQFLPRRENPKTYPTICRAPVLFTRKRTLGYPGMVDAMIDTIKAGGELPEFMKRIVAPDSNPRPMHAEIGSESIDVNGEDEAVLLTKDANAEQLEIARRLTTFGGVVVQGPPGTGKTHTIANLIGHLLAQNKRILVTSHTARALEVVRDKIVEPLQALCVTVLGTDAGSRSQMETAINAITGRLASSATFATREEIERIQEERRAVLRELKERRKELILARRTEYDPITLLGATKEPSAAAKWLAERSAELSWIPGKVARNVPLALNSDELAEVTQLRDEISDADEATLRLSRPSVKSIPSPETFAAIVTERAGLEHSEPPRFWSGPVREGASAHDLLASLSRTREAVKRIRDASSWERAATFAGLPGSGHLEAWQLLLAAIRECKAIADEAHATLLRHEPKILSERPEELLAPLRAMRDHRKQSRRPIGGAELLFRPRWKAAITACSVRGSRPESVDHFEALILFAEVSARRRELRELWVRVVGTAAFDITTHTTPEAAAVTYADSITASISWHPLQFQPAIDELIELGFTWTEFQQALPPNAAEYGQLDRIIEGFSGILEPDARTEYSRRRSSELAAEKKRLQELISAQRSECENTRFIDVLVSALEQASVADYTACYEELSRLSALEASFKRYEALLSRLEPCAPDWAAAIAGRKISFRSYANAEDAYLWKQFDQEIAERSKKSIPGLQHEIELLSKRFKAITSDVTERLAWNGVCERTTHAQQAALQRYKKAVKMLGAGTGKRAPKFARLAQAEMEASRGAVPVWVMPLSRVYDTYRTPGVFDVIILDEASQADLYALLTTCLGNEIIVVGDDEQVTPERPGVAIAQVDQIIENALQGIPGKNLFIEESSIFDFALAAFGTPVRLTEHFRCLEPIIRFSNALSYNGAIKPLRDAGDREIRPATVAISVPAGIATDGENEEEAKTVASLLCAMIEFPEYNDATFGVIALSGTKQPLLIEQTLRRYLEPKIIEDRRIRCGAPPQFQGDERTVMLLSVVDSPDEAGKSRNPGMGPRDRTKKRYNVAASRARDQMWVCHSLDPNRLDPTDLRRRLILHAMNPDGTEVRKQAASDRAESEFERLVQARLIDAGYRVVPQHSVGSYRIDILVTDGVRRLAVECDGDRYHTQETLAADVARQMILERCGYRFERIRGTAFFRDPERAMEPVLDRLERMHMLGAKPDESPDRTAEFTLRQSVIARAAELREEWRASEDELQEGAAPARRRGRPKRTGPSLSSRLNADPESDVSQGSIGLDRMDVEVSPSENSRGLAPELNPEIVMSETLVSFFRARGVEIVDKRSLGGRLWLIGGRELNAVVAEAALQGFLFYYTEGGSRATDQRPAWYLQRS